MLRDAKRMHFLWQPTPVQQEAIDKCIDTCLPQVARSRPPAASPPRRAPLTLYHCARRMPHAHTDSSVSVRAYGAPVSSHAYVAVSRVAASSFSRGGR